MEPSWGLGQLLVFLSLLACIIHERIVNVVFGGMRLPKMLVAV